MRYSEYDEATSLKGTDLLLSAIDNGNATFTSKRVQVANTSAATLLTSRKINGVSFNGSADINGNNNNWHGVVARTIGATNPLPTNLTTPVFTLGASANNISYYYLGTLVNVTTNKTVTLNDDTGPVATSGSLVIGYHYKINTYVAGDDFSNVATTLSGTVNTTGYEFTATGITPTTWSNGSSLQRIGMPKTYFIYFDGVTGNIAQGGFPGITGSSNVIIALVNWNGTDYGLVCDERHGYTRDRDWHLWAHDTVGVRWESGITLTASGSTTSSVLATTAGVLHDEDLEFAVPASSTFPTANSCRVFYQTSATTYAFENTLSVRPYKLGTSSRATYVNSSNSYTLTTLPSATNRYVNVFFYATADLTCPIYMFVETAPTLVSGGYTTLANARAVPFPNLSAMGISPELKPIYRVIINADGTVQTITSADDYRSVSSLPQAAGNASTTASAVTYVPSGALTAGNVQAAIDELEDVKLAISSKATGSDITTGTDDAKYVTSKALTDAGIHRWSQITGFTATPTSTSTLTFAGVNVTATLRVGIPVRYTIGGTIYYGIITASAFSTDTVITVAGASLTSTVTKLEYGFAEMAIQANFFIAGPYGDGANDLLTADMNTYFKWDMGKAYLVSFVATEQTVDTGTEPKVGVKVNNALVSTNDSNNGIQLTTAGAWVSNPAIAISTTNYDINNGEAVEITCTVAGGTGDAANLTVQAIFVLA